MVRAVVSSIANGPLRGFLVHAVQVLEGGRAVVNLYCRGEDGDTFLVRDTRFVPYFHIAAAEAARVPAGSTVRVLPSDRRALHGGPVVRVEAARPQELRAIRDQLTASGVVCYEADLRPASRYLIDRGLKGALAVSGSSRPARAPFVADRVFDDPAITPAEVAPALSLLSLLSLLSIDIETTADAGCVLSIALHGAGSDEVLLLWPPGGTGSGVSRVSRVFGARLFGSERELLAAFVSAVRARDPDILTGWNVIDFDLAVLLARARALGVPLALGRDGSEPQIAASRSYWASSTASVIGRMVLDGIQLLRGAFVPMDEYGLDYVARRVLGEGKTINSEPGAERVDEIQRMYREDPARLVAYNLHDAHLAARILDKLNLIRLSVQRSLLTGMPLDRVSGSIASFDSLYLPELNRRGVVAPPVGGDGSVDSSGEEPQLGGLVLEPAPGLYTNVFVFDFKSLYPSLIRTFQIDPLGHMRAGEDPDADCIVAPSGARFRRDAAILPGILDRLFPQREAAKRAGDAIASHAIKILMNSLYGVLGSSSCRFYDAELANAITGFGREILLWVKARIEDGGRRVLYGDTDSLFVLAADSDVDPGPGSGPGRGPEAAGRALLATLNDEVAAHLRDKWGVPSRLELEFDTLYRRLHLPTMRQSGDGARKRYVGLVDEEGTERVVFTGMEVVRRDWTELAKQVQRELYERLFHDRPVADYVKDVLQRLRRGELDEQLVYRKALRKPLESYTASTPPHVAAARKMTSPAGRLITYVITTAGPEPASERRHPIDRAHYVDKQLRPVAEPVLELLGLDFEEVTGTQVQLRLF